LADAVTSPFVGEPQSNAERAIRVVRWSVGLLACLLPIAWVVNPFGLIHPPLIFDQFTSAELGLSLSYVLLSSALTAKHLPMRWVNVALAAASLALTGWLAIFYNSESFTIVMPTVTYVTVAVVMLVLCIIAGWRGAGPETVLLIIAFLVLGYFVQFGPSWLNSAPIKPQTYVFMMVFGGGGVLGLALQVICQSVVVFLIFGLAFELAGGSRAIGAVALLVARFGRGAAISVCIIASALFGMISGSATSNVLAAGSFSIPGMKKMGLAPASAGGIEAVASTIGQVMPPVMGAAAFLMATATGIPYPQIALASLAPALLCYLALFLQGEAVGRRLEARDGRIEAGLASMSLRWVDLLHIVPVGGLVWCMVQYPSRPELSGAVGAGLAFAIALILKGPRRAWADFRQILPKAGRNVTGLVVTAAAVGILLSVISVTGLDSKLTILVSSVGERSLFLALLVASVTAFLLGLGLGTSGVYIITGTLLAPGLIQLGVPTIAAHLFVLYSAMLSMITPPVAFASLTAAGLAGAGFYETSNQAMKFGWALFLIPFLIAYSPELVLVGDPWTVTGTIASVFVGVLVIGHFSLGGERPFPWWSWLQWAGLVIGIALILPVFPLAGRVPVALLALVAAAWHWSRLRQRRVSMA
jgi:TRAP transporter 4TM/12TM fusion protein